MDTNIITGRDLLDLGWKEGRSIGAAIQAAKAEPAAAEALTERLIDLKVQPEAYVEDSVWGAVAAELIKENQPKLTFAERDEPAPLTVWGRELIDQGAFTQIENAARLPNALRVALMPDAHVGYGLPIGGVAALEGAIAPYMVGVDIGCRMHATIFDRSPIHLKQKEKDYKEMLLRLTYFGRSPIPTHERRHHPILDDPRWEQLPRHLRNLKDTAVKQVGSSGGGNHFAEWTELTVYPNNPLGISGGKYIALITHSGSRGVGYKLANYYSKMAEDMSYFLPNEMRKLGYLDFARGEGEEYEIAMSLAGDFAKACHEQIHERIVEASGATTMGVIQNHHNYAWRVEREGQPPVFIHRKGATPADEGVLGIIPGSMATTGFFVEGRGDTPDKVLDNASLNSASHGSGRVLGRRQAIKKLDAKKVRSLLEKRGVMLLGGGLDEAPDAYKNPHEVIAAQSDLVKVWAEFSPKIVRMAADSGGVLGEGSKRARKEANWKRERRKKNRR